MLARMMIAEIIIRMVLRFFFSVLKYRNESMIHSRIQNEEPMMNRAGLTSTILMTRNTTPESVESQSKSSKRDSVFIFLQRVCRIRRADMPFHTIWQIYV